MSGVSIATESVATFASWRIALELREALVISIGWQFWPGPMFGTRQRMRKTLNVHKQWSFLLCPIMISCSKAKRVIWAAAGKNEPSHPSFGKTYEPNPRDNVLFFHISYFIDMLARVDLRAATSFFSFHVHLPIVQRTTTIPPGFALWSKSMTIDRHILYM